MLYFHCLILPFDWFLHIFEAFLYKYWVDLLKWLPLLIFPFLKHSKIKWWCFYRRRETRHTWGAECVKAAVLVQYWDAFTAPQWWDNSKRSLQNFYFLHRQTLPFIFQVGTWERIHGKKTPGVTFPKQTSLNSWFRTCCSETIPSKWTLNLHEANVTANQEVPSVITLELLKAGPWQNAPIIFSTRGRRESDCLVPFSGGKCRPFEKRTASQEITTRGQLAEARYLP